MLLFLEKKHNGKPGYENMYSIAKHVCMDDGIIDSPAFAVDKENSKILKGKIDAR